MFRCIASHWHARLTGNRARPFDVSRRSRASRFTFMVAMSLGVSFSAGCNDEGSSGSGSGTDGGTGTDTDTDGGDTDTDTDGSQACPDWAAGVPSEVGEWSEVIEWPVLAVHAVHLPATDQVLLWSGDRVDPSQLNAAASNVTNVRPPFEQLAAEGQSGRDFFLWNVPAPCPAELSADESLSCDQGDARITNWTEVGDDGSGASFTYVPYSVDFFCAGHTVLGPSGQMLMAGGNVSDGNGITDAALFDPTGGATDDPFADFHGGAAGYWHPVADMAVARWYPSLLTLPSGDVLAFSGEVTRGDGIVRNFATEVERFDPQAETWTPVADFEGNLNIPFYPFMYTVRFAQQDAVLYAGSEVAFNPDPITGFSETNQYLGRVYSVDDFGYAHDPDAAPQELVELASELGGGTSVMYAGPAVMKTSAGHGAVSNDPSQAFTEMLMGSAFEAIEGMDIAGRFHVTAVTLPDGSVVAVGGNTSAHLDNSAVDETELFDPEQERWCKMAERKLFGDDPAPRLYHSNAFLLPDGRVVLTAGGKGCQQAGENGCQEFQSYQNNAEFYAPPYLFKGPRPVVGDDALAPEVPSEIGVTGGTFPLTISNADGVGVSKIGLMRTASVTHGFSQDNRYIELDFTEPDGEGRVCVTEPSFGVNAPPGPYMLFVISDEGVPSVGGYVTVSQTGSADDDCADGFEVELDNGNHISGSVLATCRDPSTASIGMGTFDSSLKDLCESFPLCRDATELDLSIVATLMLTDGTRPVGGQRVVATGSLQKSSGTVNAVETSAALGEGDHVVELCVTEQTSGAQGCLDQDVRVEGPLGSGAASDGRYAGEVAADFVELAGRRGSAALKLEDDDEREVSFPPGFTFPLFGQTPSSTVVVGANGGLRFSPGQVRPDNGSLPSTDDAPDIAVYWDDLDPGAGGDVLTFYDGLRFIVSWEQVPHAGASGAENAISAQVHLYADGRVVFQYLDTEVGSASLDHGADATIGIQGQAGVYIEVSHDDASVLKPGRRGIAFDEAECIASGLRIPPYVACTATDAAVTTCQRTGGMVRLEVPDISECSPGASAVAGSVVASGASEQALASRAWPVPVIDGEVTIEAGVHQLEWTPVDAKGDPVGSPFRQLLRVGVWTTRANCCDGSQLDVVLTESGDIESRTGDPTAVCVQALGGEDIVTADAGDDTLLMGEGGDTAVLGAGHNRLMCEAGSDIGQGGASGDQQFGGRGDDTLDGFDGDDLLHGEDGNDLLDGGDDQDEVWGGAGNDIVAGGAGDDDLYPGSGVDIVQGEGGSDAVYILDPCELTPGKVLDGGSGSDVLWLPEGVTQQDVLSAGVILVSFETVAQLPVDRHHESDCGVLP